MPLTPRVAHDGRIFIRALPACDFEEGTLFIVCFYLFGRVASTCGIRIPSDKGEEAVRRNNKSTLSCYLRYQRESCKLADSVLGGLMQGFSLSEYGSCRSAPIFSFFLTGETGDRFTC